MERCTEMQQQKQQALLTSNSRKTSKMSNYIDEKLVVEKEQNNREFQGYR